MILGTQPITGQLKLHNYIESLLYIIVFDRMLYIIAIKVFFLEKQYTDPFQIFTITSAPTHMKLFQANNHLMQSS